MGAALLLRVGGVDEALGRRGGGVEAALLPSAATWRRRYDSVTAALRRRGG